jgi:hypothetical protein
MTGSYAQYPYVGDDPAGVESAMSDLQGVGGVLGSLAGEVEHDTQSIKDSWPKGRTGGLAAADGAMAALLRWRLIPRPVGPRPPHTTTRTNPFLPRWD